MEKRVKAMRWVVCLLAFMAVTAATASGQGTTSLWIMTHSHQPFNDWVTQKAAEYMELHPEVEITYNHLPHGEFDERVMVLLASGVAPDILNVYYPTMIDLVHGGFVAQAPPSVVEDLKENFIPSIIEGMTLEGHVYGYPTEAITLLPVVNEYLYEVTGIDLPESYQDLLEVQRKMTLYNSDGNVIRQGVTLSTSGLWQMLHWSAVFRAYGGEFLDENGRFVIDSPEGRLATEDYRELAPLTALSFTQENVGTVVTGPYSRIGYVAANPSLKFRAIPALRGVEGEAIATSYFWGMVVNHRSQNPTLAWEFLRWLNADVNKRSLLEAVSYPPVTFSNISYYQSDPWFRTFAEQFMHARTLPVIPNWTAAQNVITDEIFRYLQGEMSVTEALANAAIKANAVTQ